MNNTPNPIWTKIAIGLSVFAILWASLFRPATVKKEIVMFDRQTLTGNKLSIGVVTAPPISSYDPNTSTADGYAIDVVRALARKGGLEVSFVPVSWETMTTELDTEKIDVVAGPIFLTETRARESLFSDPLFAFGIVAVVLKNAAIPRELKDLKTPGLRVAVGRGGFDADFVTRFMPEARQSVFPPGDATIPGLEVLAKRTDLALMDYQTATQFVTAHPEVEMRFESNPVSMQYAGYMFRKRDQHLRDFWNIALRNLDLDGELRGLDEKYATKKAWYARVSNRPSIVGK